MEILVGLIAVVVLLAALAGAFVAGMMIGKPQRSKTVMDEVSSDIDRMVNQYVSLQKLMDEIIDQKNKD